MQQPPTGLSDMPSYLMYLLLNPTFNLNAALILYAVIVVFLLLVLVVGILGLTRQSAPRPGSQPPVEHDAEFARLAPGESFPGHDGLAAPVPKRRAPQSRRVRRRSSAMTPAARRISGAIGIILLLAAWSVAGYTTSRPSLCKDCHWPTAQHASAVKGSDRHADVACVSCHERGGLVGRYVTGLPARLLHFADANADKPRYEYGSLTTAACSRCHRVKREGVVIDQARGLKMSHREPLEASAACIDCHALRSGIVGTHNAGMGPCLRCHDSAAESAACALCHDTKVASAARARTSSFTKEQIADVSCGGCHDEEQQCDPCHGLRMPHSKEYKLYAHSRAGVISFWYDNGATCAKCHTAARRSCGKCHSTLLGSAHGEGRSWLATGHQNADVDACDTCHKNQAYTATRDFCKELCHTSAAVAASPR